IDMTLHPICPTRPTSPTHPTRHLARQLMQPLPPRSRIDVSRKQLESRLAELLDPLRVFGTKLLFELLAEPLRKRRALARRRDRDLEIAAVDDGRVIKIAIVWIVHRIAQDAARAGSNEHSFCDVSRHRRHDQRD